MSIKTILFKSITKDKAAKLTLSIVDQAFATGTMFLANVILARAQTKEEYGFFVISYSIFVLLSGVHNALIIEPYTVFGSGRYHQRFSEYFYLMFRAHGVVCISMAALIVLVSGLVWLIYPSFFVHIMLGLALALGFILTGSFLRRTCYVRQKIGLAPLMSVIFFLSICFGLWVATKMERVDSFTVYVAIALGWLIASIIFLKRKDFVPRRGFYNSQLGYWKDHWRYAKWVLLTAFVFQLTSQGYYWIVAGILSAKDLAELRAAQNIILPINQVLIALSLLVLPVMARHYAEYNKIRMYSLLKRFILLNTSMTLAFAIIVWFVGPFLLDLLYGGKYNMSLTLLYPLSIVPFIMGIGHSFNDTLKAAQKPNIVYYSYIASGTVTLTIGVLLIKKIGLMGAVYGLLASSLTYTVALTLGFYFAVHRANRNSRFSS